MIWLTWRQQRFETLIGAGILAGVAALLLITGMQMSSAFQDTGIAACLGAHPANGCVDIINAFQLRFDSFQGLAGWLNFLPLVFGLLLGAPFVQELESGTYRLAWTQSISRTRWVAIKLGVVLAITLLAAGIFTALMTWWRLPFDRIDGSLQPNNAFDFEGTVPFAYAIFAVALGITAGTMLRRTIPAFALSIAGFLAARLGIIGLLRPHYLTPLTSIQSAVPSMVGAGPGRRDWILTEGWSDRAGHMLSDSAAFAACPPSLFTDKQSAWTCFASHHIYNITIYQPASRFWLFQGIETGMYLGATALLLGIAVWWVRRRIQ